MYDSSHGLQGLIMPASGVPVLPGDVQHGRMTTCTTLICESWLLPAMTCTAGSGTCGWGPGKNHRRRATPSPVPVIWVALRIRGWPLSCTGLSDWKVSKTACEAPAGRWPCVGMQVTCARGCHSHLRDGQHASLSRCSVEHAGSAYTFVGIRWPLRSSRHQNFWCDAGRELLKLKCFQKWPVTNISLSNMRSTFPSAYDAEAWPRAASKQRQASAKAAAGPPDHKHCDHEPHGTPSIAGMKTSLSSMHGHALVCSLAMQESCKNILILTRSSQSVLCDSSRNAFLAE